MRIWKIVLAVSVLVHIRVPDDWPEDAVRMLATEAVALRPPNDDTIALEVENIDVDDVVEICVREPQDRIE